MFTAKITFAISDQTDISELSDRVFSFLETLRMNGQVCGREFPIAHVGSELEAFIMIPEEDSLDIAHSNSYVQKANKEILDISKKEHEITVLGIDPGSLDSCICSSPSSYILYTNYVSLESPLRCGDCFLPVPLYRIPPTANEEYSDIIVWQSDYQCCDRLQMNAGVALECVIHEISQIDSNLSKSGLSICKYIHKSTNKPTYYYLMKIEDDDNADHQEAKLICPMCGKDWHIHPAWHDMFTYKCNSCMILSD